MKPTVLLLLSAWVVALSPLAAKAQEDVARVHMRRGLEYAASGDTALAFSELQKAVKADSRLADARYHIGRLYTARASSVETDFQDRMQAERALLQALRISPADPRYLFELGRLRMKQHMNVDASRLLRRAISKANEIDDPAVRAELHFSYGYMKEKAYRAVEHQRFRPMFGGPPVNQLGGVSDLRISRYTNNYLERHGKVEGAGEITKDEMLEQYRSALRADPGHVGAATRLMGQLLDEYQLGEYMAVGRRLQLHDPDRPEPYLFLGLGHHASGREDEASEAFEKALERLTDMDRAAIENLAPVMRRRDAEDYLDLSESAREAYHERYWLLTDPLFLTDANERRLEHLARVAYADLRYSAPATGRRGWETDRGVIFIRYGPPEEIGSYGADTHSTGDPFMVGRRSIIWSYGREGPVFVFQQMPGYMDARFAGDYKFIAENYRHAQPAKYDNIPSIPELLSLPVQIARFRGGTNDEVAVEIHAALPLEELARDLDMEKGQIDVGLFVLNRSGQEVIRRVEKRTITYANASAIDELRSWRVLMPESDRLVAAVEVRDGLTWRAAAARDTFTAFLFSEDTVAVSDILIADVMRPLVEEPRLRSDFDIVPNPAMEFESGDQIHIYYELYGLGQDDERFASYDVALGVRVKKLHREGTLSQLLGGLADAWGFSVAGDDRLELRFSREVGMADRDRVIEYLSLDPREAPAGEYELRLRIWDRLREQLVTRYRTFTVIAEEE